MLLVNVQSEHETKLVHYLTTEKIIEYQVQMINNSEQEHFARLSINAQNLAYNITSYLSISQYFRNTCFDFISVKQLLIKIIEAVESTELFLLSPDQIVAVKDYLFYDSASEKIIFLYQPFHVKQTVSIHEKIKTLILSLVYENINFNVLESDYMLKNLIAFLQTEPFDLYALKAYLITMKKTRLQKKNKWISRLIKKNTCSLSNVQKKDETLIMSYQEYPILEFEHQSINIDKESFSIGRSAELNDCSLPKALSIGRVHAEIIKESGIYYLIDISSKNGTFVNQKKIESQKKYVLSKGDVIQFANEKATFK